MKIRNCLRCNQPFKSYNDKRLCKQCRAVNEKMGPTMMDAAGWVKIPGWTPGDEDGKMYQL